MADEPVANAVHYPKAADCPDVRRHTKAPTGYLAWHEWAEKKSRTHKQERCSTCGFYAIWKRKRHPGPEVSDG